MRIQRATCRGDAFYGLDAGDGQVAVCRGDPFRGLEPTGRVVTPDRILAPVRPVDVYCIGLNYRAHAAEAGLPIPDAPVVFMKPVSSVVGPGHPIRIPACCDRGPEVDYEGELAVVIGRPVRDADPAEALEAVLGYTAANDVSARRWQKHNGGQWVRGKSFDTFCPLGPALVTRDEIPDPQALRIRTRLNGDTVQDGGTDDMIFPVAEIIAFLSRDTTLAPGTVILTGTPPGVGFARKPPLFLRPGDRVAVEIEPIGALTNPVEGARGDRP